MNFERGQNPLDSMKIGVEANCIEIYEIHYNQFGPQDDNIHNVLKNYESGAALKWSVGTRFLFEERWEFKTNDKNWQNHPWYKLGSFAGMRIQYKGKYYKIPEL